MARLPYRVIWTSVLVLAGVVLLFNLSRTTQPAADRHSNAHSRTSGSSRSEQIRIPSRPLPRPARKQFQADSLTTAVVGQEDWPASTGLPNVSPARQSTYVQSLETPGTSASQPATNQLGLPELILDSESRTFLKAATIQRPVFESDRSPATPLQQGPPMIQPVAEDVGAKPTIQTRFPNQDDGLADLADVENQSTDLDAADNHLATDHHEVNSRQADRLAPAPLLIAPAVLNSFAQKVRYANSLARRGAVSSAFEELQASLKLLAEAIDQLRKTQIHSDAVHAGFVALSEVSDFSNWSNDLSVFVAGHETEVLRGQDLDQITFHEARLAYLGYAEQQLRMGCENLPLAAETFRSLGKVYLMQEEFENESSMSQAKSMLMFRLATSVNPRDAAAARELGVLYAKYNHFNEARDLLVQSLQVRNDAETWKSLSRIHRSMGESQLAQQAANEAVYAANLQQRTGLIYWTDPRNFHNVQSMVDPPVMTVQQNSAAGQSGQAASGPGPGFRSLNTQRR